MDICARLGEAENCERFGDILAACEIYEGILAVRPTHRVARRRLHNLRRHRALLWAFEGRTQEALAELLKLAEARPGDEPARLDLADLLALVGQQNELTVLATAERGQRWDG